MKRKRRQNEEAARRQPQPVAEPLPAFERPFLLLALGTVLPVVVLLGIINGLVRPFRPIPWYGYLFWVAFAVLCAFHSRQCCLALRTRLGKRRVG